MEFFHEPKIDWMGIKWYFISLSLALALTGIISMVVHQGLVYGIDFRGGTLVDVKFSQPPNIDAIRHELDRAGLRNATIQGFGPASDHAVIIGLDLQTTTSSNALDTGKQAIITGLSDLYGKGPEGKTDFNNASPQTVADHLTADDPLGVGAKGLGRRHQDLSRSCRCHGQLPERSPAQRPADGFQRTAQRAGRYPGRDFGACRRTFTCPVTPSRTPRSWARRWAQTCAARPFT